MTEDPAELAANLASGPVRAAAERQLDRDRESARREEQAAEVPPPVDGDEPADDDDDEIRCTDAGNSRVYAEQNKDRLRYVPGLGWLAWDGRRWKPDETGEPMRRARSIARYWLGVAASILRQAEKEVDSDKRKLLQKKAENVQAWARQCESAARLEAVVKLAQSEPGLVVTSDKLDRDPWLLNCRNGTLDLRTGKLLPRCRDHLITKLADVDFALEAPAPRWEKFLARVQPNHEVRAFLARLAGYWLTGVIREHILPIQFGRGRNGKGVFHNSLRRIMADYATQIPPELLMERRNDAHPCELMVLRGCRFAVASETAEGCSLNVAKVKAIVGGDPLTARLMRENFVTFEATHKLSLATNRMPRISETGHAIWERVFLIDWPVTIPEHERNLKLEEELLEEASGILAWAARGCLAWQRDGLAPPDAVRAATKDYREGEDNVGQFLADRCVLHPASKVASNELYAAYLAWISRTPGESAHGPREFRHLLAERGLTPDKGAKGKRIWRGVGLLADDRVAQGGGENPMNYSRESPFASQPEVAPPCATCATDGGDA